MRKHTGRNAVKSNFLSLFFGPDATQLSPYHLDYLLAPWQFCGLTLLRLAKNQGVDWGPEPKHYFSPTLLKTEKSILTAGCNPSPDFLQSITTPLCYSD